MNKKNEFFSFIMDEEITNKQALLAISVYMSILSIMYFCEESMMLTILSAAWFLGSIYGCKRNGMLDDDTHSKPFE